MRPSFQFSSEDLPVKSPAMRPQASTRGETLLSQMIYGRGGHGYRANWSGDHVEQVRHNTGWQYIAVNAIAETVASLTPRVAYLRDTDDILMEKARIRERYTTKADRNAAWRGYQAKLLPTQQRTKALVDTQPHEQLEMADRHHPLCKLLRDPNRPDVAWTFWYEFMMFYGLTGVGYIWAPPNPFGLPAELWVMPSHWVWPVSGNDKLISGYDIRPWGAHSSVGTWRVPEEDLIQIRKPGTMNKVDGYSTLQAIAEWVDIAESIDASRWAAFKQGIWPSLILKLGEMYNDADDEQIAAVRARMSGHYEGEYRHGRAFITPPGVEVSPWSGSAAELEYSAGFEQQRDAVLAGYRTGKAVVGITEEVNRASMETAYAGFFRMAINPPLRLTGQVLSEKLARRYDPNLLVFWPDPTEDDPDTKRADITMLLANGAMTPNEARTKYGLPPYKHGGDDPLVNPGLVPMPLNTGEQAGGGMDLASLLGQKPGAEKPEPKEPEGGKEHRLTRMFTANGTH